MSLQIKTRHPRKNNGDQKTTERSTWAKVVSSVVVAFQRAFISMPINLVSGNQTFKIRMDILTMQSL